MPIEITARHLDIAQSLQEYARSKAERLIEEFPKTEFVHVVLDQVRHLFLAQVVLQHKGFTRLEADDTMEDMIAAIDSAFDKSVRQLRKHREKLTNHHPRNSGGKAAGESRTAP